MKIRASENAKSASRLKTQFSQGAGRIRLAGYRAGF
jgi:hypothetical protein